jgi:two-component system, chemotaxis family, protein-glutamate methylesterase/glutaminase
MALPQPVPSSGHSPTSVAPIRVMVVDDSAIVRGFIVRILEGAPGIEVAATCSNGQMAVQQAERMPLDVIILDVEMPVMDGLTAVPKLLAACPGVRIVMASTLTQRNATVSIEALAKGATDYIPKPSTTGISTNSDFRRELVEKVTALGRNAKRAPAAPKLDAPRPVVKSAVRLRSELLSHPKALVIGASTGGPQALMTMLAALPREMAAPILIAQHMPATFTAILAQHITRTTGRPCSEAVTGQPLRAGEIHLAPGDFHMEIAREGTAVVTRLTQAPPENFCRPSVNPLFRSAARVFGADLCAVMLTGMGSDGLDGTRAVAAAGAPVIAQDEATSVVWGMPGAIATAGLCTAVLPLASIAGHVAALFEGRRP